MRDFVLNIVIWEKVSSKQSELSACFNSLGAGGKGRWNIKHTLDCSVYEHLESKAAGIWPQNGGSKQAMPKSSHKRHV